MGGQSGDIAPVVTYLGESSTPAPDRAFRDGFATKMGVKASGLIVSGKDPKHQGRRALAVERTRGIL